MPGTVFLRPGWRFVQFTKMDSVLHIATEKDVADAARTVSLDKVAVLCLEGGVMNYVARQSWPGEYPCSTCWGFYQKKVK